MIEEIENLDGTITNELNLEGTLNKEIKYVQPTTQEKTATPSQSQQIITPDENVFALSKVTINAIPSEYIVPSGTLEISANGTYDVKNKEYANVNLTNKWTNVGYNSDPEAIDLAYNEALRIYNNWDLSWTNINSKYSNNLDLIIFPYVNSQNVTSMSQTFNNCSNLIQIPLLDTSNVQYMLSIFYGCKSLKILPLLDTHKVTTLRSAFKNCQSLTDESLDNILKMCINATSTYSTKLPKTLQDVGLMDYYTSSKIQSLPSYQNFINAGWSIY